MLPRWALEVRDVGKGQKGRLSQDPWPQWPSFGFPGPLKYQFHACLQCLGICLLLPFDKEGFDGHSEGL